MNTKSIVGSSVIRLFSTIGKPSGRLDKKAAAAVAKSSKSSSIPSSINEASNKRDKRFSNALLKQVKKDVKAKDALIVHSKLTTLQEAIVIERGFNIRDTLHPTHQLYKQIDAYTEILVEFEVQLPELLSDDDKVEQNNVVDCIIKRKLSDNSYSYIAVTFMPTPFSLMEVRNIPQSIIDKFTISGSNSSSSKDSSSVEDSIKTMSAVALNDEYYSGPHLISIPVSMVSPSSKILKYVTKISIDSYLESLGVDEKLGDFISAYGSNKYYEERIQQCKDIAKFLHKE